MLPHLHGYLISAHGCLRGSSQLLTSYGNQEGSLGAGVLDGRAHKPVDELFYDHLAGECLRDFDHGREVELLDGCFDRARWTRRALVLPQPRMKLIELPHLSVGAPSQVAPPRVSQVEMRNLLEATRRVKAGSQLVGERLVVDKAIGACRRDGSLVQVHGLERASFDTGNLSTDQRRTILKVLRAICCPGPKLLLVLPKCFSIFGVRVGARGLAPCSARQRCIEVIFRLLQGKEGQRRGCRVPCLHLIHCLDRRHIVAGEEARLELSDPVVTFQEGARGLTRDALFEGALHESTIVEGAELRGSSAQGPGERDWRGKSVEEESVPLHEFQRVPGFALKLVEWMAQGKKNGAETAGGECSICRVAVLFGHLEGTTRRFDALL